MPTLESGEKLTRYLLGELSAEERIQVEDRYLTNAEFFDELVIAEDELIDDYVRGELSRSNRELFERNFLCSAARQERVKSARALMRFADTHATSTPEPSRRRLDAPAMRLIPATGFILLVVGGLLLVIQVRNLRSDLHRLESEQLAHNQRQKDLEQLLTQQKLQNDEMVQALNRERGERGQLEQDVARLRERQASSVTFALGFGEIERSRGGPAPATKLTVPQGTEIIRLRLDLLKDEYQNYMVTLEDARQRETWRGLLQSTKAGASRAVVVRFPSRLLATGQYRLILSGTNNSEVVSEFHLDITRK